MRSTGLLPSGVEKDGIITTEAGVLLYSQHAVEIKMVRLLYPDAVIVETNDRNTPVTEKAKLYTNTSQTELIGAGVTEWCAWRNARDRLYPSDEEMVRQIHPNAVIIKTPTPHASDMRHKYIIYTDDTQAKQIAQGIVPLTAWRNARQVLYPETAPDWR